MNTTQLKDYAPRARRDFIAAVEAQAAMLGITAKGVADARVQGDILLVGGQAFPKAVAEPREKLAARVRAEGFEPTEEAIAYTWFNRLVAIRYMELHGYLEHGFRVLSHPQGQARPEILDHAADVELPGLDRAKAVELKLDGTKDEELYRLLLTAQCNALHKAMPFLFERLGDETELLLPANLLHTDSLVRQLVEQVDEALWREVEIIGWLYQFYISEKKDEVSGKVVKSEDIPAATQLFTPNWIVKYMVQNSLGAQWLGTYPRSPLKGQMEYYIEPAKQTEEVNAQIAAITPKALDPEELTLLDPACGSGHILVEAYELFKAIYLERGYRLRDVVPLILEKNLFGFDIDERAAQLTGFALMMKGRADDRRLFERGVKLNVMVLVDSVGFDAEGLARGGELADSGLTPGDVTELWRLFEHATTYGSLIQVPEGLVSKLPALKRLSEVPSRDLFVSEALKRLGSLVRQAELLAAQYDAVVANPPYMGSKSFCPRLKVWMQTTYQGCDRDLFSAFVIRIIAFTRESGAAGVMTSFVWMFITTFESFRKKVLAQHLLASLVQLHYDAFADAKAHVCTYLIKKRRVAGYCSSFVRLTDFPRVSDQGPRTLEAIKDRSCGWFFEAKQDAFDMVPGSPVAYWVSPSVISVFKRGVPLGELLEAKVGLQTGDNDRFLRRWAEVSLAKVGLGMRDKAEAKGSGCTWFPYNKGGAFRKWYGNREFLVNWQYDGRDIASIVPRSVIRNPDCYFQPSLSWSDITSGPVSFRVFDSGFMHDTSGMSAFGFGRVQRSLVAAYCNTPIAIRIARMINPTLHFNSGNFASIPFLTDLGEVDAPSIQSRADRLVEIGAADWNAYERSWDFESLPILTTSSDVKPTLESNLTSWIAQNRDIIAEMQGLEEENNRIFIDAYGLAGEVTPDVPVEQVTLTVNPAYRYGGKLTEEELWVRFRQDTIQELVSYAIGCMMGRYSLDAPGLIYAHSGNEGFDSSRYTTFPADDDGIVPITDTEWFDDDAAHRVVELVSIAWDEAHLEDNLTFLAENLSRRQNESSRETVRRYLCDGFFKDHLQTYKKRPIYWLFSSGKQKAFQCLVYLHRYNAGTLARMRSEYVIPLQGKMAARLDKLQGDIQVATSTAHQKRLEKERSQLAKQQVELLAFDEKLRHYADRRITLDLDDGVKVNYGKFGDLLAEVKAVTGGAEDE